jgi:outer membrane receptor protein involved in Fe transport
MSYVAGELFPNNSIRTVVGTAQVSEYVSMDTRNTFLGYFGRLQYSYRRKYLLALSGRYDGSSRFGADRQFGFFPAVSAGWVLSEEPFLRGGELNLAKLRGSVGLTGNAEIGDFISRGLVELNQDYFGQVGYAIRSLENRRLGWEKSLQWNAGLDLIFWDYRLRLTVDYYVRDTRDLLLENPVPVTSGVPVFLDNVGSIRNQGFEFELTADLLRGPFSWTVSLNGATLRSEVLRLADEDGDGQDEDVVLFSYNLFRVGKSPGVFYLVPYAGVDPQTGDALYQNPDGSLTTDYAPSNQRRVAGRALPRFTGGMSHQFRYRGVDLLVFFHFKTGHSVYMEHGQLLENNMANGANQLRSQQDAWTPDHTDTDVPQARLGQNNGSNPSTRYLEPAGFLRLNNLSLGYTFSPFGKTTTQLRVFAAAQNLFILTGFRGLDPDTEFNPVDAAAQGRQRYNLPAARTFTFGFNLSL